MLPLELVLRTLGFALLGLLAGLMLRARRKDHTARIGAALALSVGAFMLTSMPGASRLLGALVYPLTALCSTHPVWFWLFCHALFSDGFRMTNRHRLAAVGMAALGLAYQVMWEPNGVGTPGLVALVGYAFGAASLGFACLAPLSVFASGRTDLDERRQRLRRWFVPLASTYLAIVVITQGVALLRSQQTPAPLVVMNLLFIDLLALLALLTFVRMRVVNWLDLSEASPVAAGHSLSRVEQSVLERLRRRLVPERLYAREGLTVASLAAMLETQEHVLRRVINRGLGFRNFNDFLHSHRLREAADRLRDPAAQRVPVLTIALEAGYGSIGPFNRAFRERFGVTPTEYRRAPADTTRPESPAADESGSGRLTPPEPTKP
jgi:AraC-like DNA-binding protein